MIVPGSLPSSANYPLSVITSENIKDHLESIIEALTTVLEEYSKKIVYTPFLKDNSISSKDVQEPISDNITLKDNPQDREMPTPLTKEEKLKSMLKENWQKILNSSTIPKPIVNVSNERENITSHINEIILVYRNSYSNEISDLIKRYKKLSEDYNLFIRINEGLLLYSSLEKHDCFYNDKAPSSTKYGRIESIQKTETESIITFSNEAKKIIIKNKNNAVYESEIKSDKKWFVSTYKIRDDILWAWCYVLAQQMTQTYVKEEDMGTLTNIKLLMIITNVLLDDLAENLKEKDTFMVLKGAILSSLKNPDSDFNGNILKDIPSKFTTYGKLAIDSWALCMDEIKQLLINKNITEEVKGLFYKELHAAYENILNAMEWSLVLEKGYTKFFSIGTDARFDKILSHNMNMIAFEILDRYSSKKQFHSEDVENFKYGCWERIQEMGQTANHISTSTREISEQDYSNPLFWVTYQLSSQRSSLIEKIQTVTHPVYQNALISKTTKLIHFHKAKEHLYARWLSSRSAITDWAGKNKEISEEFDVDTLIKNADILTCSYLIFKGKL